MTGLYPHLPGYKEGGTSRIAAEKIGKCSTRDQRDFLDEFQKEGWDGLTADEIAARLGLKWNRVRPRVTELYKLNLIVRTGERRKNEDGNPVYVYRHHLAVKDPTQLSLLEGAQ